MEKNPLVSIIIVHYNVEKQLYECIKSLYAQKEQYLYEIIVVDNDEKPTLEKTLKQLFPKVQYIKSSYNSGYSAGNNLGAKYAKGDFLFFLNPDTLLITNVIDQLVSFYKENKNIGVVAPLLLDTKKNPYPLQGARELTPKRAIFSLSFLQKLFPNNRIANDYWIKEWNKAKVQEVDVVPGSAFMIRKSLFEKINGFDEKYFLYFEEHDICNRIKRLGYKIFMFPNARIVHRWGESTKKSEKNIKAIFQKSRFYYLKKFYGLPKAVCTEGILRFSKETLLVLGILILAAFLRFYAVERLLPFIGDFAWFYLSAKDMILSGNIPLVGIASSHPWIHQGAFWTYLLVPALILGNFHPVAGGYLAGIIGVLTVFMLYVCTKDMFDQKTALFASAFYATSPLIVLHARLPYHTAPIPLFVMLFIYSVYKWMKGNAYYFPVSLFFLVVLYNFELATAVFALLYVIVLVYGVYKKSLWVHVLKERNIWILSFLAILVPLSPMLLYDVTHGFSQTLMFIVWLGYRVLVLFGYPSLYPEMKSSTFLDMILFLKMSGQRFYYLPSGIVAACVAIGSFAALGYESIKVRQYAFSLLTLSLCIPFFAVIISKTPSDAYLPMLFIQAAVCVGIVFSLLSNHSKPYTWVVSLFFILLIVSNSLSLFSKNFLVGGGGTFKEKNKVAKQIISSVEGKEYTIVGVGAGSQFESFIMPYTYLVWWLGYPIDENAKMKVQILEDRKGIHTTSSYD